MAQPPLPSLPGVTHREVTVRGVRLHVAQAGSGPPLLLVHGWPHHWWCWRHLIAPLAEHYTVLAPDLRGWGWSQAPPGDYAKQEFADDLLALLDHEGIERARVLAHDWGAYASFLLALGHPERVERLVALDITPPWRSRPTLRQLALPLFLSYQVLLASPLGPRLLMRWPGFVRALLRLAAGPDMQWSRADQDLYAEVQRDPARARASSACYRTFLTRELPGSLTSRVGPADLRVPTLLIMGGASTLYQIMRPAPAPTMEVVVIPRGGHCLADEMPDQVLALAAPFLARP